MKEVLQKELDFISNDVIHDFVSVALDNLPEYFWSVPASSSGKYHPSYALGNGGLVRHTIAAVNIADILFNLEQYQKIFDSDTRDCIYAAIILHDGFKQGRDSASNHTVKEHAVICADWLINEFYLDSKISGKYRELISGFIRTHMGQWDENNKPVSPGQKFVHMCDYLASRKNLIFDFGDRVTSGEVVVTNENLNECVMPFGKHKGKLIKDLAENDLSYLEWAYNNMTYLKEDVKAVINSFINKDGVIKESGGSNKKDNSPVFDDFPF